MPNKELLELENEALIKRLNYVLDASIDGIWDWTPADGIIIFSKAWVEMLGYEVGELASLASEWSDRLHPEDKAWVFAEIGKVTQSPDNGDTFTHEYRFRNKAGEYLWILNKAKVVERNEKGEASRVVGTHTNITERKRAEEEIKRTNLLLSAAQHLTKMGAWELDLATGKTFWTDEVYDIHEVSKDFSINNINTLEFYHPDYRSLISKAISDSITKQTPFDEKCKFLTAKNNLRWVRASGYPVVKDGKVNKVIGMFTDITQEETDKEEIAREQLFSKQLLENMADGFSVIDLEGRQTLVNKAFCDMTGFSEDELIGQKAPYPYWPAEELENIAKAFQKTLDGELSSFELTFQTKNGKRFPVQLSTSVLKDEFGNTINYFANIKDITEKKQSEFKLQQSSLLLSSINKINNYLVNEVLVINEVTKILQKICSILVNDTKFHMAWVGLVNDVTHEVEKIAEEGDEFGYLKNIKIFTNNPTHANGPIVLSLKTNNSIIVNDAMNDERLKSWNTERKKTSWNSSIVIPILMPLNKQAALVVYSNTKNYFTAEIVEMLEGCVANIQIAFNQIHTQKKLKISENRLRAIIDYTPECIKVINSKGELVEMNASGLAMLEANTIEDVTSKSLINFVLPNYKEAFRDLLINCIAGKRGNLEFEIQGLKGTKRWLSTTAIPFKREDSDEKKVLGLTLDITQRKISEFELLESEKNRNEAQSMAKLGRWELNLVTNQLHWSDSVFEIFEIDKEQFGENYEAFLNIIHPDDHQLVSEAYARSIETKQPYKIEHRLLMADGRIKWVKESCKTDYDEKGKALISVGIVQDVTEMRESETQLANEKYRLSLILEGTNVGTWEWNIKTGETVFNERWAEIIGYTLEEISPVSIETWKRFTHPDDLKLSGELLEKHFNGELDYYEYEARMKHKEGYWVWVNDRGKVHKWTEDGEALLMSGTHQDITERKVIENELKITKQRTEESEARLILAQAVAKVGSWETDLETLEVVWSEETYKIFGTDHLSFQASHSAFLEFVHPEDKDIVDKAFLESFTKTGINVVEHRIITLDNIVKHVEERWQIHLDLNGKPIQAVGTCQDIGERKLAENELKRAKEKAEAANNAKSEFLANMSHEIRTPLNGVIGFTELLTQTPLNPIQQQYANYANVSGHALLGIINDILDFSKIEAGMLELEVMKTDLVELLKNSIDIVKFSAADKKLELLLDIDPSIPPYAHIDPIRTKQILANLLSNAVKFTQKGEVALRAVYQALEGKKGKLSISVRDTGIGITEEQKSKLFKSFSQADNSTTRKFGGTGLGLVISQMIAEKMGSKIKIDSTAYVGSNFSFDIITDFEQVEKLDNTQIKDVKHVLKIDENVNSLSHSGQTMETIHQQVTEKSLPISNTIAKIKILIAEDNSLNMMLTKTMISKLIPNCECYEAKNGLEAIDQYQSILPDLIFMDIQMPELDGTEATKKIRELEINKSKQVPIIALTAGALKEEKDKCLGAGMDDFITKPIESSKIKAVLNKFLKQEKNGSNDK